MGDEGVLKIDHSNRSVDIDILPNPPASSLVASCPGVEIEEYLIEEGMTLDALVFCAIFFLALLGIVSGAVVNVLVAKDHLRAKMEKKEEKQKATEELSLSDEEVGRLVQAWLDKHNAVVQLQPRTSSHKGDGKMRAARMIGAANEEED